MALTVTGIVLMIIASLLYYVTVQEIRQIKTTINTINNTHDTQNINLDRAWKKICLLENEIVRNKQFAEHLSWQTFNDVNELKILAGNAARNADEALEKVNEMSFGDDYIPKHGKEHE